MVVRDGEVLQTMFGALPHSFLIGRPFGCKVRAKSCTPSLSLRLRCWCLAVGDTDACIEFVCVCACVRVCAGFWYTNTDA